MNINVLENLNIRCQTASTFQIIVSYAGTSNAWKILFATISLAVRILCMYVFLRHCIFNLQFFSNCEIFSFFYICVLNVFSLLWIDFSRFFYVSLLGHDNFLVLFLCVLYRKKKKTVTFFPSHTLAKYFSQSLVHILFIHILISRSYNFYIIKPDNLLYTFFSLLL